MYCLIKPHADEADQADILDRADLSAKKTCLLDLLDLHEKNQSQNDSLSGRSRGTPRPYNVKLSGKFILTHPHLITRHP